MKSKIKADARNTRPTKPMNYINGANQTVSSFDFKRNKPFGQCQNCGSDYLKYAVNGICQGCLQKVEFINREYPEALRNRVESGGNR